MDRGVENRTGAVHSKPNAASNSSTTPQNPEQQNGNLKVPNGANSWFNPASCGADAETPDAAVPTGVK